MKKYWLYITLCAMCLPACEDRVSQEELIEAAVILKVDQWRASQLAYCKEQAMLRAESYVDSFLLAHSLESKLDTITKPDKPIKPSKPVFKEKPDSLKVKEVLPEKKF